MYLMFYKNCNRKRKKAKIKNKQTNKPHKNNNNNNNNNNNKITKSVLFLAHSFDQREINWHFVQ